MVFLCSPQGFSGSPEPIFGAWYTNSQTRTVVYLADVALRLYGFGPEVLGGFSTVEVAGSNFLRCRFSLPSVGICRVPSQQISEVPSDTEPAFAELMIFYSSGSMLQL